MFASPAGYMLTASGRIVVGQGILKVIRPLLRSRSRCSPFFLRMTASSCLKRLVTLLPLLLVLSLVCFGGRLISEGTNSISTLISIGMISVFWMLPTDLVLRLHSASRSCLLPPWCLLEGGEAGGSPVLASLASGPCASGQGLARPGVVGLVAAWPPRGGWVCCSLRRVA